MRPQARGRHDGEEGRAEPSVETLVQSTFELLCESPSDQGKTMDVVSVC